MLPTFMTKKPIHKKPEPPPSGRVECVRLLAWPRHMDALSYQIGTIEGMIGDDVLVRFGEVVVQVPPEWLESSDV
jgi:hypothetical protein